MPPHGVVTSRHQAAGPFRASQLNPHHIGVAASSREIDLCYQAGDGLQTFGSYVSKACLTIGAFNNAANPSCVFGAIAL
jgi:hypothetical protein